MDKALQGIVADIEKQFGAQPSEFRGRTRLIVAPEHIVEACRVLRDQHGF